MLAGSLLTGSPGSLLTGSLLTGSLLAGSLFVGLSVWSPEVRAQKRASAPGCDLQLCR